MTALCIEEDGYYIDGTFGRGGHSQEILRRLGATGRLLAFDKDPDAHNDVPYHFIEDKRFELIKASFTSIIQEIIKRDIQGQVSGVLFDFGLSSPQLDDSDRGFSFRFDAPLDMRVSKSGTTVSDWLAIANVKQIADVLYQYGEERASRKIARAIVEVRKKQPIVRTSQLVSIIRRVVFSRRGAIHPATRTFQALRIFINNELDEIRTVLPQAANILKQGGRLITICFHSLEDRIVKKFIKDKSRKSDGVATSLKLNAIGKVYRPNATEIEKNPRARSAMMRIIERC